MTLGIRCVANRKHESRLHKTRPGAAVKEIIRLAGRTERVRGTFSARKSVGASFNLGGKTTKEQCEMYVKRQKKQMMLVVARVQGRILSLSLSQNTEIPWALSVG